MKSLVSNRDVEVDYNNTWRGEKNMDFQFNLKPFGKIRGVDVYHSDDVLKTFGFKGACTTPMKIQGKFFPRKVVIVDSWFLNQKQIVKDFVLLHEVGHIKHHDSIKQAIMFKGSQDGAYRARSNLDPRVVKMEMDADKYAASIIGIKAAKKGLVALSRTLPLKHRLFSTSGKEIRMRIKNL